MRRTCSPTSLVVVLLLALSSLAGTPLVGPAASAGPAPRPAPAGPTPRPLPAPPRSPMVMAPPAPRPPQDAAAPAPSPSAARPARPAVLPLTHAVCAYGNWSPDGGRLAYQSSAAGVFDLYTIARDGSDVRRIVASPAHDITPVWSPDGRRIAFVSERDGNREVYLVAADGSGLQRVTEHPASDIHPVWSADGARLLFSSNRDALHDEDFDLYEMAADGSDVRRITSGPEVDTYGSWSPDGRRIVTRRVLDGNSEVFLLDADGGNPRNLSDDAGSYDGWPAWSPSGRLIAYAGGGPDFGNKYLYVLDPESGEKVQLTFPDAAGHCYDTQPSFSPDGQWLVFTRYAASEQYERAELFTVRVPAV